MNVINHSNSPFQKSNWSTNTSFSTKLNIYYETLFYLNKNVFIRGETSILLGPLQQIEFKKNLLENVVSSEAKIE